MLYKKAPLSCSLRSKGGFLNWNTPDGNSGNANLAGLETSRESFDRPVKEDRTVKEDLAVDKFRPVKENRTVEEDRAVEKVRPLKDDRPINESFQACARTSVSALPPCRGGEGGTPPP